MRTFRTAVFLLVAGTLGVTNAAAQTPPPPPPPPPAAPAPAEPPPAAPPPAPAAPPPAAVVVVAPAATAPATPAPGNWYDKFSGDAFVDAYGSINWNFPKPQGGTTQLRAFDTAQGFALSWIGLDASYAADPIGGTIGLRFGPSAVLYNGAPLTLNGVPAPSDNTIGMQNVRQAYATWKPADKLTLDFGKFDQPFGSEVPDAQLNMEYTRSLLFFLNQPVFFTGLRLDYAASDMFDVKVIAANGWNNTFDSNRSKSFGAQVMVKPVDSLVLYLGYMGGPEQPDVTPTTVPMNVASANDHWRHLVDLVVDFNPTKELRFLLNGDFDTEDKVGSDQHSATWYGANLAIRYQVADPFAITLRGEYFHDEHGDIVTPAADASSPGKTNIESGTLTLSYVVASHLYLMFDNRIDIADSSLFTTTTNANNSKTQFTTTLGVVATTK